MKFIRKTLQLRENKVLTALADFYYEHGYKAEAYVDPETGGIYENKFAERIGYKLIEGDKPPPEFTAATTMLEAQGYVRRIQRREDFPIMGVWPTLKGLDRAEYLNQHILGKTIFKIKENWAQILIAFITTLITLTLSSVFGLFGLGGKSSQPTEQKTTVKESKQKMHNKLPNKVAP